MKTQIAIEQLINRGIVSEQQKKIAQNAKTVCKLLDGLSYTEAKATLDVAQAMCEDYCFLDSKG